MTYKHFPPLVQQALLNYDQASEEFEIEFANLVPFVDEEFDYDTFRLQHSEIDAKIQAKAKVKADAIREVFSLLPADFFKRLTPTKPGEFIQL